VIFRECANGGNLIIRPFHSPFTAAAKQLRLNPDREKLRIQTAGFRAHRVEMAVAKLLLQIDVLVKHTLNSVGVHIDGYCAFMNSERITVGIFGGRSLGHGRSLVLVHVCVTAAGEKKSGAKERNQNEWFKRSHFDVTQASLQQASVLAKRTISTVLCPVPT
jgi:hypothetical protein